MMRWVSARSRPKAISVLALGNGVPGGLCARGMCILYIPATRLGTYSVMRNDWKNFCARGPLRPSLAPLTTTL